MFRCELCDSYLPIFQMGHLCEVCYKIRTIIKCYSAEKIHDAIATIFLVDTKESDSINTEPKNESEMDDSSYMAKPLPPLTDKKESYSSAVTRSKVK